MASFTDSPEYIEVDARVTALMSQYNTLTAQAKAATESGNDTQATEYLQQAAEVKLQAVRAITERTQIVLNIVENPSNSTSPTVTTEQSQSTPANANGTAGQVPNTGNPNSAASTPGVAQSNDDNYGPNTVSGVNAEIDGADITPGKIITQPNVLDQYASYTYTLGWYLITQEQFNTFALTNPNFETWSLLVQSGGAAPPSQKNTTQNNNQPVGGRNQYFSNDFYIDNLTMTSLLVGKGTNSAHSVSTLEFTVFEPSGITLPNILAQAVKTFYKEFQTKTAGTTTFDPKQAITPDYGNVTYVMVVTFWGYDDQGNLWSPGKPGNQTGGIKTEQGLIVRKYFPFKLKNLNYKLASKGIEYKIEGIAIPYSLHTSTQRASIPFNMHLVGKTLEQILNGNGSTGTQAVEGRESTNTKSSNKAAPPAPAETTAPISLPSIATGRDNPLFTPGGMDFTAGNF